MDMEKFHSFIDRNKLPTESKFLGYTLFLPETEEFLAKHQKTKAPTLWGWTPSPIAAVRFKDEKSALRIAKTYTKRKVEVLYLIDTPTQLLTGNSMEFLNGE